MTTKPLLIDALELKLGTQKPIESEPLSITAVSLALKNMVETNFSFVRLKGEISGFKQASSGHLYFALKDDESVMDAICWKGNATKLGIKPEDGLEVICTGKITTYPNRSKYQIIIDTMQIAGQGSLLKLLEERKKKLEAEGLFSPERKKKIPFLPEVIGVITSPTGSVIRDIMHRLNERFPRHVLLWPALMQGESSAKQVATAIKGFNDIPETGLQTPDGIIPRPDVLIVARGGGSLEDLWPFNEEIVVRATADSEIPIISAVGHETDTTLIDYASDLRAPTPTGAAEKAVPVKEELQTQLLELQTRLHSSCVRLLNEQKNILTGLTRGLPSLTDMVEERQQKLDDRIERMENSLKFFAQQKENNLKSIASRLVRPDFLLEQAKNNLFKASFPLENLAKGFITEKENRYQTAARLLESFSYERTLERGFALVLDSQNKLISTAKESKSQTNLTLKFYDDTVDVVLKNSKTPTKPKKTKTTEEDNKQGLLL